MARFVVSAKGGINTNIPEVALIKDIGYGEKGFDEVIPKEKGLSDPEVSEDGGVCGNRICIVCEEAADEVGRESEEEPVLPIVVKGKPSEEPWNPRKPFILEAVPIDNKGCVLKIRQRNIKAQVPVSGDLDGAIQFNSSTLRLSRIAKKIPSGVILKRIRDKCINLANPECRERQLSVSKG